MKKLVHSLNAAGIEIFADWLKDPKGSAPTAMLDDPSYCVEIAKEFWVDINRVFDTTFELGKYLH